MFENNNQQIVTPQDREVKSNDESNGFENLELHVDADFS